ncbi:DnaJ homolog subfamily C member 7 [Coccomyxa sp. Obi]|nr:DnaJ homolog subfamily C member 7 [Coccomyxa sp. Obi]
MSAVETLPPRVWLQHKERGDQAFRTGHYSDAVTFYSDAVNACNSSSLTDRAKLFANRALAFQRAGEWQQCLKDGMSALSSDSKYVKGWWRLGTALAALDMKEEALQAFTCALELDPSNLELQSQLERVSPKGPSGQANGAMPGGKGPAKLRKEVQDCIAAARARMKGEQPPLPQANGHAQNGTNGLDVKSKQAQKRARAKARKAAKAGENEDTNGSPMLSRSQSNASSDASQPFIPRSSPVREEPPPEKQKPSQENDQPKAMETDAPQPQASVSEDPSAEKRAKGTEFYQAGNWQSALAAYKEAAALAPDVAANHANCAAAALMLRRYKEAAAFAAQAAVLDPTSVRAHMRAGKACLSMGRFDEAAAHYQRAAELEPARSAAQTEAVAVAAVRKHIEEGNAALDTDARQAQWYADVAARAVAPALLEPAMLLRCKALMKQGKYSEALGESRSLTVEGDPAAVEVLLVRAKALYGSGNMDRALKMFEEAMRRDPDSTACARGLKRCRALVSAKEQGNTAFKERRWGDAHRHYSDAIARFAPGGGNEAFFAQCFSNRSATCAKMGRHQDALSDAEEAIKCDATFVKGYLRRAAAHEALKNWEDAVRDYEKVQGMDSEVQGIAGMLRHAKTELKKSKRVDYYKLLDISQDASENDIKKAYKRAALRYHPDKAVAEEREEAEKKFKQVGAAHAILSDPAKRQKYDAGWTEEEIEQGCTDCGMGGYGGGGPSMDDLLAQMFAQQRGGFGGSGFPGGASGFPGGRYGRPF